LCDNPSTLKETFAITALIQAMAKKFSDEFDRSVPFTRAHSSVIRENKWRACRYGLDGEFITEEGDRTVSIKTALEELISSVENEAGELNSLKYLAGAREILAGGGGAARQLAIYKETGDLKEVVRSSARRLYGELSKLEDDKEGVG
ncbi:MAG: hypothetical protein V3T30_05015, partial [Thermodesulfobacteriota bacterium]